MLKNILANFVGKFWSLLSVFIFVPLYIQILGFNSYSVISFILVIAGVVTVLDAGLTATLSREFARVDISQELKSKTLITLESIYVLILGIVILGIFSFSGLIADSWLNTDAFANEDLTWFLRLISFDVAFQMLFRFYVGGVLGLEKQVFANVLQVGWGVLRNGLVVIVIWLSPNLNTFFIWQAISTVIFALLAKGYLKKLLNGGKGFDFSFSWQIESQTLSRVWKFAGGMMLISLVAALNSQMDKIAISKLLPLETLGHYTLSVSLGMALLTLVNPIAVALLPRFTSLYTGRNYSEAKRIFQLINVITTTLVFAFMVNMIFYPFDLIWIWTGDASLSRQGGLYLPYLAFSFGMLGLAIIPYNIAIANGDTRLNNILGLTSLILTLPSYWVFTKLYGAIGAAVVYAIVQFVITLIFYYIVNRKYLKIGLSDLYIKSMLLPLLVIVIITFILKQFHISNFESRILSLGWIGLSTITGLGISLLLFVERNNLKNILYQVLKIKKLNG